MKADILSIVLIIATLLLSVTNSQIYDAKRSLQTCNVYQDCSSCNEVNGCVYLNDTCQAETTTLQNTAISSFNSTAYCHESLGAQYFFLRDFDYNLDIYQYENVSMLTNSLCEWRIINANNEKVTLTINRNPKSYEEFSVNIYTGTGHVYYQTKDLSNCNSNTAKLEFQGSMNFILKAKKLSENSNYTINVHQRGYSEDDDDLWILLICCFSLGIIVTIFVGFIVIVCIYYKTQPQQRRVRINYTQEDRDFRKEHISKCLDNIRKDEFKNIRAKFDQSSCIICLDDFEPGSEVCITNECNHVFHFVCLHKWFKNIRLSKDLTCPHCNTVITDTSKPIEESIESDSAEIVDTSEVFDIPDKNMFENQLANYAGLISSLENQVSKTNGRETNDGCIIPNQYEDI